MRSTVASGPIPPMMPTMRCINFDSGCRGMPRTTESEVIDVAKQPDAASGVDKHGVLSLLEHSVADQIDETRHTLAGINRIKQDSLEPGKRLYGIEGSGC